ncbi:MAG: T9SS C-terminal target domain-containing protein, partial [Ignavibacteriales bacterium]
FFFLTPLIYSQVIWDPLYNLSNTPSATSDYHAVHSDENGNYYVVWGDNGDIKFKHSSDYGLTWSPNIIVFTSNNICGWPVVKSNQNHVYVVCHQLAGDYEILFRYSSDYGQTWNTPQIISGMDDGSITPQLAISGSDIIAAWERRVNNFYDIIYRRSTDHGVTWSPEGNISGSLGSHSRWLQIEAAGSTVFCTWLESVTYPESDIYFSKSTDGGETWWLTPPPITNDPRPQNRIYMKVVSENDIYIVSDDIITFNFDELYLMYSSNGGNSWSTPSNITNNAGHSNTPCLEVIENNLYLTWADNSHTAPAYDNMDIFFKWSSDNGVTWQDSINLSDNPETSSRPRICSALFITLQGVIWADFTVVWYDYSTGDAEILARNGTQIIVPVELTSFTSEVRGNDVLLNWTTASELNNKGFEIEKSQKSKDKNQKWEKIGFVEGKGTTTEEQIYSFTDNNLAQGIYQYRLNQFDFDGTFEYSDIVEVNINSPGEFYLSQNYPNPFNPVTNILFAINSSLFVSLKVYDVLGNEVASLVNEEKDAGEYKVQFNAEGLGSGIYFYSLKTGNNILTNKMLLLK